MCRSLENDFVRHRMDQMPFEKFLPEYSAPGNSWVFEIWRGLAEFDSASVTDYMSVVISLTISSDIASELLVCVNSLAMFSAGDISTSALTTLLIVVIVCIDSMGRLDLCFCFFSTLDLPAAEGTTGSGEI